jgi:SAM-dependent methyltransferase
MTSDLLNEITSCEVCGNQDLRPALNLGDHPMCDDLVAVGDSRVCREYPIDILFCDRCLTAHQHYQIPKHLLFPPTYHYRSRHTADVLDGMRQLVAACKDEVGDFTGRKVLDIGCNDGSLLTFFRDEGAMTFGIEPTGAAADAAGRGHKVKNEFLTDSVAKQFVLEFGQPDVITFTNVFAHIEDLHEVIRALKTLSHPGTLLVIENHYLGAVIDKHQFDTFYHEHPRTYSCTSFAHIAESLEMRLSKVEFPKRYGGNIRVFMKAGGGHPLKDNEWEDVFIRERHFEAGLVRLATQMEVWRAKKRAELEAIVRAHGKLPAKAFPGRAAILIKLLMLDETIISAVFEKPGSGKIGHYVPGTRIPIMSDDDFHPSPETVLLNLAWHISNEIKSYMRGRGYEGRIIDIIAHEDFSEQ